MRFFEVILRMWKDFLRAFTWGFECGRDAEDQELFGETAKSSGIDPVEKEYERPPEPHLPHRELFRQ